VEKKTETYHFKAIKQAWQNEMWEVGGWKWEKCLKQKSKLVSTIRPSKTV